MRVEMGEYPSLAKTLLALGGDGGVTHTQRALVKFTGSLETGLMLGQLLYWTPRSGDGWIAKTDTEFADELCLTVYGVRKARAALEEMGILKTGLRRWKGAPTTHYHLDLEVLQARWTIWLTGFDFAKTEDGCREGEGDSANPESRLCENAETCTDTTVQNTTLAPDGGEAELDEWLGPRAPAHAPPLLAPTGDEPYLAWGDEAAVFRGWGRVDVPILGIKEFGYWLETTLHRGPRWGDKRDENSWAAGLKALWETAEGDLKAVGTAARRMREDGLTIATPFSLVNVTRDVVAERKLAAEQPPNRGPYLGRPLPEAD